MVWEICSPISFQRKSGNSWTGRGSYSLYLLLVKDDLMYWLRQHIVKSRLLSCRFLLVLMLYKNEYYSAWYSLRASRLRPRLPAQLTRLFQSWFLGFPLQFELSADCHIAFNFAKFFFMTENSSFSLFKMFNNSAICCSKVFASSCKSVISVLVKRYSCKVTIASACSSVNA